MTQLFVPTPDSDTFRIATMNINGSSYHVEERYETFVNWVKIVNPDVLFLQEIMDDTTADWFDEDKGFQEATGLLYSVGSPRYGSACAIYSKTWLGESTPLAFHEENSRGWIYPYRALGAEGVTPAGHKAFFLSAHLPWGPYKENVRLQCLQEIENWSEQQAGASVSHTNPRVYLGGDFNAEPNNISVRWLRGEDFSPEGVSTRWTDGWERARERIGDTEGITSTPKNMYALETARDFVSIPRPEYLPDRRIDYLFIRGYAFGSLGTPIQAGLWGQCVENHIGEPSDHYGVWADVLDVPLFH